MAVEAPASGGVRRTVRTRADADENSADIAFWSTAIARPGSSDPGVLRALGVRPALGKNRAAAGSRVADSRIA
jgi:hypothetical protein